MLYKKSDGTIPAICENCEEQGKTKCKEKKKIPVPINENPPYKFKDGCNEFTPKR